MIHEVGEINDSGYGWTYLVPGCWLFAFADVCLCLCGNALRQKRVLGGFEVGFWNERTLSVGSGFLSWR